jgi:hypothetical protein
MREIKIMIHFPMHRWVGYWEREYTTFDTMSDFIRRKNNLKNQQTVCVINIISFNSFLPLLFFICIDALSCVNACCISMDTI